MKPTSVTIAFTEDDMKFASSLPAWHTKFDWLAECASRQPGRPPVPTKNSISSSLRNHIRQSFVFVRKSAGQFTCNLCSPRSLAKDAAQTSKCA